MIDIHSSGSLGEIHHLNEGCMRCKFEAWQVFKLAMLPAVGQTSAHQDTKVLES